ncbi:hypothetical protein BDR26DRAFT_901963 [Obelidium mucronatum]|nr:hypothetical protein BDR26DRAFT_901963 [Obelidium mucronatum]
MGKRKDYFKTHQFRGPKVTEFIYYILQQIGKKGLDSDSKQINYLLAMVSQAVNKEYAVWAAGQTKTINFKELTNWFATNYKDQDIIYSLADLDKMARKQRSRGIFVSDAEYLGEYNSVLTAMDDNAKPGDAVAVKTFLRGLPERKVRAILDKIIGADNVQNNDWKNFCKVVTTLDKLERSTKAVSKGSRRKKRSDSSSDESSSDAEEDSSSESSDSESSSSSSSESCGQYLCG